MNQTDRPRLFLVDSFALAFRIFYAFARNPLVNSKGQDNSLVHGYWSNLLRVLSSQKPTHFAVVKDMGQKTFRHDLYPDYKANRGDMPEEMKEQLPRLDSMLECSGLPVLGRIGFEADDLMAHLALKAEAAGYDVYLVTKDKDMGQIVSEHIRMFQLEKGNEVAIQGPAEILEKFGVPPSQMRDYLALVGDSSDNVPGVPKVGPKTAVELLKEFGSLDGVYQNLDKISRKTLHTNLSDNREKAYLSRELVTLQTNRDFGITLGELVYKGVQRDVLRKLFLDQEMKTLVRQLETVPDQNAKGQQDLFGGVEGLKLDTPAIKKVIPVLEIETLESLKELISVFEGARQIAVDFKANGTVGWNATLERIGLAVGPSECYSIHADLLQDLFRMLSSLPSLEIVFHNAKFAKQILGEMNVTWNGPLQDTMLASWVLDPGQPSFTLQDQVRRRLGEEVRDEDRSRACWILQLWDRLILELRDQNLLTVLHDQEIPLIDCLSSMEKEGIRIDSEELGRIRIDLSHRLELLEAEIHRMAKDDEFNINSPRQLGVILFEKLGLPVIKKTSTGYSTDAQTLEELRGINPIVEAVLGYREVNKLLNTYVEVLPTLVNPHTGRLHTSFVQTGTATGRLSSRDPNLQNIPIRSVEGKRIRAAFVPRSSDWVILSADYSQIELRMLAHLSGDPALCAAYQEGQDIHTATASAIFGVAPIAVTPDMRRQSKVVNFGVLYGMTAFRLARDLGIERSAAKTFIDGYFGLYATVKDWMDGIVQAARADGAVHTITGRRRVIPGIGSHDHTERQMAERMAINSPVQGSAADLIKIAMIRLHRRIESGQLPVKMLLQVHDELVFECPKEYAQDAIVVIRQEMEQAFPLKVPLVAQVGQGRNWLEAH